MLKSFFQFSSSTEQKIKTFIDDTKGTKKSNTLMQEIAILTFSPKTLKEIIGVFRKRLQLIANIMIQYQDIINKLDKNKRSGGRSDFNGAKNSRGSSARGVNTQLTHQSLQVLNALTLMEYLLTNGSDDFVSWTKRYLVYYIAPLLKISVPGSSTVDVSLNNNNNNSNNNNNNNNNNCPSLSLLLLLQKHSHKLHKMISDTRSIDKQREEIMTFRNSISVPGRTSTDNSPLKKKFQYDGTTRSTSLDFSNRYFGSTTIGKNTGTGAQPKRSKTLYTNYKQRGEHINVQQSGNSDSVRSHNPFLQRNDYSLDGNTNTDNRNYARRSLDFHSSSETLGHMRTHGLQSLNTQGINNFQNNTYNTYNTNNTNNTNSSPTTSYRSYTSSPLSAGTNHLAPVAEE